MAEKIKLGISRCLLGDNIRWDGGNAADGFLSEIMDAFVEYEPVCPEVEIGLSIPREPMQLTGTITGPSLVTETSRSDYTDKMKIWAIWRLEQLAVAGLCGFIFKSKSPSCGITGVSVYDDTGAAMGNSIGIFAADFKERFPLLPIADDAQLQDLQMLEDFMMRAYTYHQQQIEKKV